MSRKIDLTKPLSDEDRQYLLDRGRLRDIAQADGNTEAANPVPGGLDGVNTGGASPTAKDPRLGARIKVGEPTVQAGDALEDEDDDNVLKGAALEQALEDRGLPKTGTADEKRARVAEYDAANGSEDDEDN